MYFRRAEDLVRFLEAFSHVELADATTFRAYSSPLKPIPSDTATFVLTGTTTPVSTCSDAGLTSPAANPLTADPTGTMPQVWYDGSSVLDCAVKHADRTTVETVARFGEATSAASGISFVPAGTVAADNVQDAIEQLGEDIDALALNTAQRDAVYGGTPPDTTGSSPRTAAGSRTPLHVCRIGAAFPGATRDAATNFSPPSRSPPPSFAGSDSESRPYDRKCQVRSGKS